MLLSLRTTPRTRNRVSYVPFWTEIQSFIVNVFNTTAFCISVQFGIFTSTEYSQILPKLYVSLLCLIYRVLNHENLVLRNPLKVADGVFCTVRDMC